MSRAALAIALAASLASSACTRSVSGEASMHHAPATSGAGAEVHLRPGLVKTLGVRTEPVEIGPLASELSVHGITTYDQRSVTPVFAPTVGWVEKLSVRGVGEPVQSGSVLFEIYSPNLATVDTQLLDAVASGSHVLENPYARGLRTLGITDDLIIDLTAKRRSVGRIPVRARATGIVASLDVRVGQLLEQGTPVLQIAALDSIWVTAYVPPQHAESIAVGSAAKITSSSHPGQSWNARVDYMYPELDAETRTLPVRLVVGNEKRTLVANLPVSVTLSGRESEPVMHVPRDAVIRDGRQDRVIVVTGEGRFAPRSVRIGRARGDRIVVIDGLRAGEEVVTSGQFLIDSESNLRSGLARMSGEHDAARHEHP